MVLQNLPKYIHTIKQLKFSYPMIRGQCAKNILCTSKQNSQYQICVMVLLGCQSVNSHNPLNISSNCQCCCFCSGHSSKAILLKNILAGIKLKVFSQGDIDILCKKTLYILLKVKQKPSAIHLFNLQAVMITYLIGDAHSCKYDKNFTVVINNLSLVNLRTAV